MNKCGALGRTVYVVAASDRFNYGDVLFPIICQKNIDARHKVCNVSLFESNNRGIGALATKAYSVFYDDKERMPGVRSAAIFAGGEILGAEWATLLSHSSRVFETLFRTFGRFRRTRELYQRFLYRLWGRNESNPFLPLGERIVRDVDLFFHCVGGDDVHRLRNVERIREVLRGSRYLSLREQASYDSVHTELGCNNAMLTPDSGILMSDYWKLPSDGVRYGVCFQMRLERSMIVGDRIVSELRKVWQTTQRKIALLPIGNCYGHGDREALAWISRRLGCEHVLVQPRNVGEIMQVIAKSEVFVGTSLHGIITAMSYGVPFVGVNPKVRKLDNYLRTWSVAPMNRSVEYDEIGDAIRDVLTSERSGIQDCVNRQKRLVVESFGRLNRVLCSIVSE